MPNYYSQKHNTTLDMPCCQKHQEQSYHNEKTKICMLIHHMYVNILFSLTKVISIMFERVSTHCQTLQTWVGHNAARYHNLNTLSHALPHALPDFFLS